MIIEKDPASTTVTVVFEFTTDELDIRDEKTILGKIAPLIIPRNPGRDPPRPGLDSASHVTSQVQDRQARVARHEQASDVWARCGPGQVTVNGTVARARIEGNPMACREAVTVISVQICQ